MVFRHSDYLNHARTAQQAEQARLPVGPAVKLNPAPQLPVRLRNQSFGF